MGARIQSRQGLMIQMVVVAVGNQDMVRPRHVIQVEGQGRKILDEPEDVVEHRIDQQDTIHVLDQQGRMFDEGDRHTPMGLDRLPVDGDG